MTIQGYQSITSGMNTSPNRQTEDTIDALQKRNAELEAENERLRKALDQCVKAIEKHGYVRTSYYPLDDAREAALIALGLTEVEK